MSGFTGRMIRKRACG